MTPSEYLRQIRQVNTEIEKQLEYYQQLKAQGYETNHSITFETKDDIKRNFSMTDDSQVALAEKECAQLN